MDKFINMARTLEVTITGVHAHLNSNIKTDKHWRIIYNELTKFARRIDTIKTINIDSSLPIPYSAKNEPFDLDV